MQATPEINCTLNGKYKMSKNHKAEKKKSTKFYSKEITKDLHDLEYEKAQFKISKNSSEDSAEEIQLKIELIKYLNAELENYQKEVSFLKQSLKENAKQN